MSINCYSFDSNILDKEFKNFVYDTIWTAKIIDKTHNRFHIPKYQILMTDPNGNWFLINRFEICQDIICVIQLMNNINNCNKIEWQKVYWKWY